MNPTIPQFIARLVQTQLGLEVHATQHKDGGGEFIEVALAQTPPSSSFLVRFRSGWRSAEASFVPGTFSAPLLAQMATAYGESRLTFATFCTALSVRRLRLTFRINGTDAETAADAQWPAQWGACEIIVRTPHMEINPDDIAQAHALIADTVLPLFGMLAALIGVADDISSGGPEGTPIQTLVTRYERKAVNRSACIALKGSACVVCGFDFARQFGPLGAGYIEVHHTTPVSSMGPDYVLDVAKELEPLCANCHAMAHREVPPVPIGRLRSIALTYRSQ